ncbi:non-ribosomal peptide synthetase [Rheinheimera gaetbuli]
MQEGILFHHMMSTKGDPYVMPMLFKIKHREAFESFLIALRFVMARHDVLRTAILWDGVSVPVQVVYRQAELPVTWLSAPKDTDVESHMQSLCAPEIQQMDITQGPLLNLQVMNDQNNEQHFVLLQLHHMITDHIGLEVIQQEIAAFEQGKDTRLTTPVPYREFIAHTQYQARHSDAEDYFKKILADVEEPTIPFNLSGINGDGSQIIELKEAVPAQINRQLRQLAKSLKVSPATLFHSAWAVLLGACCDRQDVVFGTVVSGRLQGARGAESMLGVFINTLPFRVRLFQQSARELVEQVQTALLDLLPFEQVPLTLAQRCSGLRADTPLFSAMLNYRHTGSGKQQSEAQTGDYQLIGGHERTNFPFNLSVNDMGDAFELDVQVDKSLNAQIVMAYIQRALAELIDLLAQSSQRPVTDISILADAERQQLLVDLNSFGNDYPKDKTIQQMFAEQVAKNPEAPAIESEGSSLTYRQLNQQANQLAHYLVIDKQVSKGELIGVCMHSSVDLVVSLLGILKAGGVYVPLDPNYPKSRLDFMIADSGVQVLLSQTNVVQALELPDSIDCISYDSDFVRQELARQPDTDMILAGQEQPSRMAYVNYTSGSTGQPKGVMVPHIGVVRLVVNPNFMKLNSATRFLQVAPISFDAATLEIWGPLLNGGCSVIYSGAAIDLFNLNQTITSHEVNTIWLTAGLFEQWSELAHEAGPLRWVLTGGDVVKPAAVSRVQRALPAATVINGYGPTENTTFSCCYPVPSSVDTSRSLPIGFGINGTQLYVVTQNTTLAPIGTVGELWVGGDGLALGYLNQEELTQQKFVANPFSPDTDERLYRTGDLVRYLPSGELEFIGRADNQVKIRGFRVEPGELEQKLSSYEDVKSSIVLVQEDNTQQKCLVAYVVPEVRDGKPEADLASLLKGRLSKSLPSYMLPSSIMVIPHWPLTENGKVDRKALPELNLLNQEAEFVEPSTDTEKVLCELWQTLLDVELVGVSDNFFELGGHSLLATRLNVRLNQIFGIKVPLEEMFARQTILELGQFIDREVKLKTALKANKKIDEEANNKAAVWEI